MPPRRSRSGAATEGDGSANGSRSNGRPTKLTSAQIQQALAEECGLTVREAHAVWQTALDAVREALSEGREVSLHNVGTLSPYQARGRRYYHPTTREPIQTADRPRVRFRISPTLEGEL